MNEIFKMRFGSHVYGTNLESSDQDFKGIFIPTPREIILGTNKETHNSSTRHPLQPKNSNIDIDLEMFSLKKYMKLLLDGQTVAVTMLFCPPNHCLLSTPISREIVHYKDKWLHKGISAYAGYCRQQANKYGIKGSRVSAARFAAEFFKSVSYNFNPRLKLKDIWDQITEEFKGMEHVEFLEATMHGNTEYAARMLSVCNRKVQENITVKEAYSIYKHVFDEYGQRALQAESNTNVDWKACMHAIRVAGEARELLTTHNITYPRPNAELLLKVRKGELEYKQVSELIEQGLEELEKAQLISTLPEKPDYQFAEDFVYQQYKERIQDAINI